MNKILVTLKRQSGWKEFQLTGFPLSDISLGQGIYVLKLLQNLNLGLVISVDQSHLYKMKLGRFPTCAGLQKICLVILKWAENQQP